MSMAKKQCQNLETVDECSARLLKERAEASCKCVPWSIKMANVTSTEEKEEETVPVCDPHGSRCYVDSVAKNRALVKSECSVNCRGLYIDVEFIEGAGSSLVPLEDDGLSEDMYQLFREYSLYRHGDISNFLSNLDSVIQDKKGWPFRTAQTLQKPVLVWDCPGPPQPTLPQECLVLKEENRNKSGMSVLFSYCDKEKLVYELTAENCTNLQDDDSLADICEKKKPLWDAERECTSVVPRRMDLRLRESCRWIWPQSLIYTATKNRCTRNKVNDTFQMVEHLQVANSSPPSLTEHCSGGQHLLQCWLL